MGFKSATNLKNAGFNYHLILLILSNVFSILAVLATCSADRCGGQEITQAVQTCVTSMTGSVQAAGNDKKIACR